MPNFEIEHASKSSKLPKKETLTISADDLEELNTSVDAIFSDETQNIEVDGDVESRGVVAVAEKKLRSDERIQEYIDNGYGNVINKVIIEMTNDEEQVITFYKGLKASTNKAGYIEQATEKLVTGMKKEIEKRIMEDVNKQGGNA